MAQDFPRTGHRHPALGTLGVLNAVAAVAGGWGLVSGTLGLGAEVVGRLPWQSTTVAAVALVCWVALPNALLARAALRGDRRTGPLAMATGVLLVVWILVELCFIRELSFFHPLYLTIGLLLVWLGQRAVRADTGVSGREVTREVRDVLLDLPVFLTSPLYRSWHLRWGATDEEVGAELPGDELHPDAAYRSTRAITVAAPLDQVWPWLVQAGCLRAGFYSDDLLDNLGHPSARRIDPELQDLHVGGLVPMSPRPTPSTSFRVAGYAAPHWLLWTTPDSTWAWRLTAAGPGRTRLVSRVRARHPWHRPAAGLASLVLLELGDFAMMRRMLRGIRDRAESGAGRLVP